MKTNKMWGLFAMTSLLVGTGCSTDEVVNDFSPENAIQFGTYVGRNAESRGSVIDKEVLGKGGFGVFAYYTGTVAWSGYTQKTDPNFMNNQRVYDSNRQSATTDEGDGTTGTTFPEYKWTYSPVKYWPNNVNDKVSFFAYAPYTEFGTNSTPITNITKFNHTLTATTADGDNATTTSNPAGPYLTFVVADDVKTQQDLLWAAPSIDMVKNATENNVTAAAGSGVTVEDKITFNFKHALAKIGFKVQAIVDKVNSDDGDATTGNNIDTDKTTADETEKIASETTIVVNKVTLKAPFYKDGVLNLNPTITKGTDNTETVSDLWSNQNEYATTDNNAWGGYVLTTTTAAAEGTTEVTNFMRSTKDGKSVKHEEVTITEQQLNAEDSYIMIIPKNFPDDGNESVEITVEYTVTTTDNNLTNKKSEIKNTVTSKFKGINFEAGKAYTFCLHLGMTSVKFEAEMTDWADATEYAVNVPLNTTTTTTTTTPSTGGGGSTTN